MKRRRPFKRVVYPSKPIDVIEIRYLGGTHQYNHLRTGAGGKSEEHELDVEVCEFDVYLNGVWKGRFDNSPRGLIDFAEAMR